MKQKSAWFNCETVSNFKNNTLLSQREHIGKLHLILDSTNHARFISPRACGAYIASTCRPDFILTFNTFSRVRTPATKDKSTSEMRMNFKVNS